MPRRPLSEFPDDARVWVFGSDRPLEGADAALLLKTVDEFLDRWHAHGTPLQCARSWEHERFLIVAVRDEAASGCSIDGLFRTLAALREQVRANLLSSGLVFYRARNGIVQSVTRPQFTIAASAGSLGPDTPVFDTCLTTLGDLRRGFERPARDSWHATLLPKAT